MQVQVTRIQDGMEIFARWEKSSKENGIKWFLELETRLSGRT